MSTEEELYSTLTQLCSDVSQENDITDCEAARDVYYGFLNILEDTIEDRISSTYQPNVNVFTQYTSSLPSKKETVELVKSNVTLLDTIYTSLLSEEEYLNSKGQFFTPPYLSSFMSSLGLAKEADTVLDPACGPGVFLDSVAETTDATITAVDKDPLLLYAAKIRSNLNEYQNRSEFKVKDFITGEQSQKYDLVIGNPPYNKFQNSTSDIDDVLDIDDKYDMGRLANLYALFFLKSSTVVKKGGCIVFLTPVEYLQTGYGNTLKQLFKDNFSIDKFIKLDWDENTFDALTTLCITVIQKGEIEDNIVDFYVSNTPSDLETILESDSTSIPQSELSHTTKWTRYFQDIEYEEYLSETVPLTTFAETKRGISTGYNDYFTFTETELDKREIEDKYVRPVLTKSKDATYYTFKDQDFEQLKDTNKPVYLLDYHSEQVVSESLQSYIKYGVEIDADERYITSHRNPWYSMEQREAPPILATVFSRDDMRFIHNTKQVVPLAAFHCVYPKQSDEEWIKALLAYLNSDIALDLAKTQYREYADGLTKLEPNDLAQLPVLDLSKLTSSQKRQLADLFDKLETARRNNSDVNKIKTELNNTILNFF